MYPSKVTQTAPHRVSLGDSDGDAEVAKLQQTITGAYGDGKGAIDAGEIRVFYGGYMVSFYDFWCFFQDTIEIWCDVDDHFM